MADEPTTHRVLPKAADAWVAGQASPPGDGFEKIERAARIAAWVNRAALAMAVLAVVMAIAMALWP